MIKINTLKSKRGVSPVIATILLISLVVVAGSMVYFLVVPMIQGSPAINVVSAQWYDRNSDGAVDIVYISIQNTGTAQAVVTGINITLQNQQNKTAVLNNSALVSATYPLEIDVSAKVDVAITFDPVDYVKLGDNIFRIKVSMTDGTYILAPENLKHVDNFSTLALTVLNPSNQSWVSGILDPQAVTSGGFKASEVYYNFSAPNGTVLLSAKSVTQDNINTTKYDDGYNYLLTIYASDYFNTHVSKNYYINIDNTAPGVSLTLGSPTYNQGEKVDIYWTVTGIDPIQGDSVLNNQTLILTGTHYSGRQLYTDNGSTVTNNVQVSLYNISAAESAKMKEDTYTVTITVRDQAGNTKQSGQSFFLEDNIAPTTSITAPANGTDVSGDLEIKIYADDVTGIDTDRLDIVFLDNETGDIVLIYSQTSTNDYNGTATYSSVTKTWDLILPSILLPNKYVDVISTVYDKAHYPGNSADARITIHVQNFIIEGISAELRYMNYGYYNYLFFYIQNNYIDTINIKYINVTWYPTGGSRPSGYYYMYSYTNGYWLNYNSSQYHNGDRLPATGSASMDEGAIHQMFIYFTRNSDLRSTTIEIHFEISQRTLNEYIKMSVDASGIITITNEVA